MPVFMPWPPAGLCTCAASPARKARPTRYCGTWAWWISKIVSQRAAITVIPSARSSITFCSRSIVTSSSPSVIWAMTRSRWPSIGNTSSGPAPVEKKECIRSLGRS